MIIPHVTPHSVSLSSGDVPGASNMVLYDATTIHEDTQLRLDTKSDEQFRIVGRGQDVMKHALAVVQLVFI